MQFIKPLRSYLRSPVRLRIVSFLLYNELLISEREISRLAHVSHMSVNRAMKELEDLHFVSYLKVGRAHVWRVNRRSLAFEAFSETLKQSNGLPNPLQSLKETIFNSLPLDLIQKAVLFGSISRGEEKSNSDIDLYILVKDEKAKAGLEPFLDSLSMRCLDKFGNVLSPYVLTEAELQERRGLELLESIDEGIVLYPSDPVGHGSQ